ncbi:DUF6164 family protein [Xanthomonas albilineans]|uniref:DUF6164 family protein n=1 Tax=Xanthomonas albilineans TaxID=29447 RepID=UPI0005F30AF3|nr:DUF6164 family protein [Xanthomonas albilineans]PPU94656.1 hypothetical protein XalbCFBP2523_02735 [Xanthomonas albilineans]
MAKRLLNLRDVPEDERTEVCALLDAACIDYYQTRAGTFGISAGGIWLREDAEQARAKALLAEYQTQRGARARAERAAALRDGSAETFVSLLRRRPLFVLGTLLGMLLVASLVLLPFVLLRG